MRVADACLVAVQLLSALGAAHRAGIVHRDVKPANVFVVQTPVTDVFVKLLDFGVAKLLVPQGPALTRVDAIIGSAPYMAPEQIRGEEIDGKTDLFALGVTLYEMLAGRRPFAAKADESVMIAILRGGPIAPLVGVPRELEAVILRALARSPSARYLTADEMTAALMPFVPQAELNVVATTAMASRAPRSLTAVDTSGTTASTPGPTAPTPTTAPTAPTTTRSSSPALAPTFAQTRDQTAVHRENVHLQAAHPHAFAHASARPPAFGPAGYAPLANAPAFAGLAPVAAPVAAKGGASSRHALFVALGVVALVALGVVARIEPSFLGSAAPRAETNAPATNVTPRMDGSCASDADCATLTHACGPCASGDLVAGVSRTNCVVNPCPKARVVCGPAHRCIVE